MKTNKITKLTEIESLINDLMMEDNDLGFEIATLETADDHELSTLTIDVIHRLEDMIRIAKDIRNAKREANVNAKIKRIYGDK